MKGLRRKIYQSLLNYGFDAQIFKSKIIRKNPMPDWFLEEFEELKRQRGEDKSFEIGPLYPILHERNEDAGVMSGHYFHQDLYVAQQIYKNNPEKHMDIGSRIDGFVAHVAAFRHIELLDIRPIKSTVKNISFRQADLMQLPEDLIEYTGSISSLHAIEHFGLGRYGDPIDYQGHIKAIDNISKMLKTQGLFYFSVPMGKQRIEFNAHRVFSLEYLISLISNQFIIQSFSYVDDDGNFHQNVDLKPDLVKSDAGCRYGCAIFTLIKK